MPALLLGSTGWIENSRAPMSEPRQQQLDESTPGLAPAIVDSMYDSFVAQHACARQVGRAVLPGPAREMAANPQVQRVHFGME